MTTRDAGAPTDGAGPRAHRPTLADVAARSGYSEATVSRALQGDARISEPTRRAVRQAAAELRYVPNAAARSLRVRRTRTLGLLLADFSDPFHGQIAAGFESEASASGYTVIVVPGFVNPANERRAMRVFAEQGTEGVALAGSLLDPSDARELLGGGHVVSVQPAHRGILSPRWSPPDGTIHFDDAQAVRLAVAHLLACGHRRFTFLGAGTSPSQVLRRSAADRVLREAGVPPLRYVSVGTEAWRRPDLVGRKVRARGPEAILCYDDKLAISLLHGLAARGVRVPDEVAVVGFDGIPFAALSNPGLTTVRMPTSEMGALAARTLVAAIQTGTLAPAVTLPVELIVRDSSGPRPQATAADAT